MISRIGRIRRIGLTPVVKRFALTTGRVGLIGLIGLIAVFAVGAKTADASALRKAPNNLGLVGYWSFEDATGTIATDFSGNGNTGTLTNMEAIDWVDGKIGKALDFDGSDERVSISLSSTHTFTTSDSFTFAGWINPDTVTGDNYLIQFNGPDLIHLYRTGTSARFRIRADEANLTTVTGGTLTIGSWYHLVGVRDVSVDKIILYVNGTQVASTTDAVTGTITTASYFLGNYQSTYTDGQIDEVRIYNRALSATEVGDLYARSQHVTRSTSQNNLLTANLLAFWPMNGTDITGTALADRGGNGYSGTISGAKVGAGMIGQSLEFDGSSAYVDFSDRLQWDFTSDFSVSAWVYLDAYFPTDYSSAIISNRYNDTVGGWAFYVSSDYSAGVGGYLQFVSHSAGKVTIATAGSVIATKQWYHVGMAYDDTAQEANLYVDGSVVATATSTDFTPALSAEILTIGSENWRPSKYYWDGKIDEVRVYTSALSDADFKRLYNNGRTTFNASPRTSLTDGLVGYWTFDGRDLNTTTSTDVSGSGNDGTLVGGVKPVIGRLGQALSFDSDGDYVLVSDNAGISGAQDMSVSAWIYPTDLSGTMGIVMKWEDSDDKDWGMFIYQSSLGFEWENLSSGQKGGVSTLDLEVNNWYHVVATYDQDTYRILLYVNGNEVYDETETIGTIDTATTMSIGRTKGTGYDQWPFYGKIDEVRVYNRVLSPAEVLQLYNMGK